MITINFAYKDGVVVKPACLFPHMVTLREALLRTAPETTDGVMWITEAYRPERHPNDAHAWCNAFDVRSWNVIHGDMPELQDTMKRWGADARTALRDFGPYQFEAHGTGPNLHLHSEFDPR